MPTPTPPPPLPDPDDELPAPRRQRRPPPRRAGSAARGPGLRRLSSRTWAIIIAALAVALVLIIGAVAGNGGNKAKTAIATDSAVTTLQRLLDGVDTDTALASCPFGSVRSIASDVHDQVKLPGEVTDAVHEVVVGGKDAVGEVLCSADTADDRLHLGASMYVYATPVPKGSYPDYLSKTLLSGAKAELSDPVEHGGGTIYAWCVAGDLTFKSGCGADWVAGDHRLVLGMQVSATGVTAKQVTAALQHELATLAARLGGEASGGTSVPGTATAATTGATQATAPAATTAGSGGTIRGSTGTAP